jgi:hypothetical protein
LIAHFVDENNEEIQMMRFGPSMLKSPLLVVMALSAFSQSSFAANVLNLNYEATAGGTQIYSSIPNLPGLTSVYGNTFLAPNIPSGAVSGSVNATNPAGFNFYDDYVFTIGGATVNSVTTTIDLGPLSITDLNERLFSVTGNAEAANGVTIAPPVGGNLQAWTYALQPGGPVSGQVTVIDKTPLAAGTYVLQIRGNVTGAAGGSYAGTLNVTPVPLPAALPLLMSGLGLVGGLFGRRRTAV